jgi:hypothetical protein
MEGQQWLAKRFSRRTAHTLHTIPTAWSDTIANGPPPARRRTCNVGTVKGRCRRVLMYLVVGATGLVGLGGEVCRRLRAAGKPTRALVRLRVASHGRVVRDEDDGPSRCVQ